MPLYEYKCRKCGHVFDVIHKISEDARDVPCPVCGTKDPVKQMSAVSSVTGTGTSGTVSGGSCGPGGGGFT
ncbi:MAG: zinc ribbon domain-containing protein [Deltaproteobacteria bacterium]|nr:zinc ribbon domain-containing protein [Candidatus Zymogenaceae bacterium]